MTIDYGVDIGCIDDADQRFRTVTGGDLIRQELYHRFTNDSVLGWTINDDGSLGPDPDADNWGLDVRRLLGAANSIQSAAALGPQLAAVAQRSGRIATADVAVTRQANADGTTVSLTLDVTGNAKQDGAPFAFVFRVTADTVGFLTGEAA